MQASEPKDTNPYVAVVAKKHRNLKKKLERIAKAEQLLAQGKVLDEEQRILLSSKKAIEKAVTELQSIKQLLEDVAKQEESEKATSAPAATSAATAETKQEEAETSGQDAATFTESAEQYAAGTMTEEDEYEAQAPEVDIKEQFNVFIERLIKALHVYQRYTNVTNQPLPDTVMYFGSTLLGLTSISSFQDTLNNSIRAAGFYLHDDLASTNDIIRGTSYVKLAGEIDVLVEEMERVQQRGSTNALTALLRTTIAPASPVNTPAPVESVAAYDSGLYGSLQFSEPSLGSFNQYQYTAAAPVYQAPAVAEPARPVVPIAPTLPEFESVVDDNEEVDNGEEELVQEEEIEQVEEVEPLEVVEDAPVAEEVAVEEAVPAPVVEDPIKSRLSKNVRVRGDPSRAERKLEDAKKHASRGAAAHHQKEVAAPEPAQKTFRDRLLSGKAVVAAPVAVAPVVQEPVNAPITPVVTTETAAEDATDKRKRAPRTNKKDESAVEGDAAAPTSAEKPKRDRNVRTRTRRPDGEAAADTGASDASKKWSAIAAASSGEAVAAETPAAADATEKKPPRSSPPKGDRPPRTSTSGDGKSANKPRREKRDDAPAAVAEAPAAAVSADGFQSVSRKTAPSNGAVKKVGEKKPSVPRGDRPAPVKKPATATPATK